MSTLNGMDTNSGYRKAGRYAVSKNARCPHYRSEQRNDDYRIRCDGVAPGSWLHIVFADRNDLIAYRDEHCKRCWQECQVAKMLERIGG